MILEYEKKQSIAVEDGCEHVVNGVIRFDDLIRTDYTPTNFSAEPKNFLLRDGHIDWDKKHLDFELNMHEEWLEELGYDTEEYYVDFSSHKIKKKNPSVDEMVMNDVEQTESIKI